MFWAGVSRVLALHMVNWSNPGILYGPCSALSKFDPADKIIKLARYLFFMKQIDYEGKEQRCLTKFFKEKES